MTSICPSPVFPSVSPLISMFSCTCSTLHNCQLVCSSLGDISRSLIAPHSKQFGWGGRYKSPLTSGRGRQDSSPHNHLFLSHSGSNACPAPTALGPLRILPQWGRAGLAWPSPPQGTFAGKGVGFFHSSPTPSCRKMCCLSLLALLSSPSPPHALLRGEGLPSDSGGMGGNTSLQGKGGAQ